MKLCNKASERIGIFNSLSRKVYKCVSLLLKDCFTNCQNARASRINAAILTACNTIKVASRSKSEALYWYSVVPTIKSHMYRDLIVGITSLKDETEYENRYKIMTNGELFWGFILWLQFPILHKSIQKPSCVSLQWYTWHLLSLI